MSQHDFCFGVLGESLRPQVNHIVAEESARLAGCRRIWLETTNDNIRAFRFYQRRGYDLCAFRRNGMDAVRGYKPEIPPLGEEGIPLRHCLEFEKCLEDGKSL